MTIKTKFNKGDKAYVNHLLENHQYATVVVTVLGMEIHGLDAFDDCVPWVQYQVDLGYQNKLVSYPEDCIFKTAGEAFEHLKVLKGWTE